MLIETDQVLDMGTARAEAEATPERSSTEMDPAAIATAHIGLEAIRRREERPTSQRRRPASRRSIRRAFAATLRGVAAAIDVQPQEPARGT
jgi:hypothetical protein